jgi:hypothetical protein
MRKISTINTTEEFNQEVRENKSVLRAVHLKCYDCSAYNSNEIKECPVKDCPLYPFRQGKNPFRKRELTDEQRQKIAERLNKAKTNKTL